MIFTTVLQWSIFDCVKERPDDQNLLLIFPEMSKKRQRCAVVNLGNNFSISAKFTDVYCNYKQQLSQNKW
jgi:hypothetical protein